MEGFTKNSNFYLIDVLHFFAKRRKSVEKMTHWKKNGGHRTSKIIKSTQSYGNSHLPYHCSLYYYYAHAQCMTWYVNFVCSKDAQKQLAEHTHPSEMMPTRVKVQSQNTVIIWRLRPGSSLNPPDNYFKSDATTDEADQKILTVKSNLNTCIMIWI